MATALVPPEIPSPPSFNSLQSNTKTPENLFPDLLCFNRLNRKHLIRLHLLHPLHKLFSLFTRVKHHPVIQPPRAYLVTSPHCLGHRLSSKQSIEFQVLEPKQIRVSVLPITAIHFNTFPGDMSHSTRQSSHPIWKKRGAPIKVRPSHSIRPYNFYGLHLFLLIHVDVLGIDHAFVLL